MGQKSGPGKEPAGQVVKEIRRVTRRQFSAEEKIRIVLTGLRGEDSIAELCRREGIVENLDYRWSKEFLEAGKNRLAGDTARAATSDEVKDLHREASALKEVVASDQTRVGRTLTLEGGAESSLEGRDIELSVSPKDIRTRPMISARTARIDDNLGRGTDGSNPLPSAGESTNPAVRPYPARTCRDAARSAA